MMKVIYRLPVFYPEHNSFMRGFLLLVLAICTNSCLKSQVIASHDTFSLKECNQQLFVPELLMRQYSGLNPVDMPHFPCFYQEKKIKSMQIKRSSFENKKWEPVTFVDRYFFENGMISRENKKTWQEHSGKKSWYPVTNTITRKLNDSTWLTVVIDSDRDTNSKSWKIYNKDLRLVCDSTSRFEGKIITIDRRYYKNGLLVYVHTRTNLLNDDYSYIYDENGCLAWYRQTGANYNFGNRIKYDSLANITGLVMGGMVTFSSFYKYHYDATGRLDSVTVISKDLGDANGIYYTLKYHYNNNGLIDLCELRRFGREQYFEKYEITYTFFP